MASTPTEIAPTGPPQWVQAARHGPAQMMLPVQIWRPWPPKAVQIPPPHRYSKQNKNKISSFSSFFFCAVVSLIPEQEKHDTDESVCVRVCRNVSRNALENGGQATSPGTLREYQRHTRGTIMVMQCPELVLTAHVLLPDQPSPYGQCRGLPPSSAPIRTPGTLPHLAKSAYRAAWY